MSEKLNRVWAIHLKKNYIKFLSHIIHKNKLQIDHLTMNYIHTYENNIMNSHILYIESYINII